MTIDQTTFEQAVPAFKNARSEIYDRIKVYLESAAAQVDALTGDHASSDQTQSAAVRLACLTAARTVIPHLDLVLTEAGFGIVSNNNVSPASKERTAALSEEIRRDESRTRDLLCTLLLETDWKTSTMGIRTVCSLLWNPTLLRLYGVTLNGKEIFQEEYDALTTRVREAEEAVARIISPQLFSALVSRLRLGAASGETASTTETYNTVSLWTQRTMAAFINDGKSPAFKYVSETLLDLVRRYADVLTEYSESSTFSAHNFAQYENKAEDTAFFF